MKLFLHMAMFAFRFLPAFRRVRWSRVSLLVEPYNGRRHGDCERVAPGRYVVRVFDVRSVAVNIATLLHEMAHVVAWHWRAQHTGPWRRVFAAATRQATGRRVREGREMDREVEDAVGYACGAVCGFATAALMAALVAWGLL